MKNLITNLLHCFLLWSSYLVEYRFVLEKLLRNEQDCSISCEM